MATTRAGCGAGALMPALMGVMPATIWPPSPPPRRPAYERRAALQGQPGREHGPVLPAGRAACPVWMVGRVRVGPDRRGRDGQTGLVLYRGRGAERRGTEAP